MYGSNVETDIAKLCTFHAFRVVAESTIAIAEVNRGGLLCSRQDLEGTIERERSGDLCYLSLAGSSFS